MGSKRWKKITVEALCEELDLSESELRNAAGVSYPTHMRWKKRGEIPSEAVARVREYATRRNDGGSRIPSVVVIKHVITFSPEVEEIIKRLLGKN